MKRNYFWNRLSLVAFIVCVFAVSVTADQFGDFEYTDNGEGIIIDKYTGSGGAVDIPDTINGLPVTGIGNWAFADCAALTSVTIPDSVTSIGECVFVSDTSLTAINVDAQNSFYSSVNGVLFNKSQTMIIECPQGKAGTYTIPAGVSDISEGTFSGCSKLISVTIPDSVTNIGKWAFSDCSRLTSITIPDSVTSIAQGVFDGCGDLTSITIPGSVTSIGQGAFWNCIGLTDITIPDSIISIGDYVFYNCESLVSITIPDSVATIPYGAFWGCAGLTSVTIPDSVTSIGESAFVGCISLTSVTIPDSVVSVGKEAFVGCINLTSVTIPDSVTSIGEEAFASCINLTSVIIGSSVTSIGYKAFHGCTALTSIMIGSEVAHIEYDYLGMFSECSSLASITVDAQNSFFRSEDGVLFNKSLTTLIKCPQGKAGIYTIPASVTRIENNAFEYCTSLTGVTIPASVTSIEGRVFFGCSSLTSVTIPNSVTSIGEEAFAYCSGLTNITIPDSVTSIGDRAFSGCTGLTSVLIPYSVTGIGNSAFSGCTALTSVSIPSSVASIGGYAFSYCISLKGVTIPNSVTSILVGAFASCYDLNRVTMPSSVTSIGEEAFSWCTSLTSITIPSSVTCIGNSAFASSGLTGITIPSGVTSIGEEAFAGCSDLTRVMIPSSVISIGEKAFYNCYSLTNVTILNGITSIPVGAFWGCAGLTSVTIPDSVTSVGDLAFYDCSDLTRVTIPSSVTSIGNSAFAGSGLTSITIPDSVTSIGHSAFWGCANLTRVTIPKSVTSIGEEAFANCSNLTGIYFQGNAPAVGPNVFEDSVNTIVYYLSGNTSWGTGFGECPTAQWPDPAILTMSVSGNGTTSPSIGSSPLRKDTAIRIRAIPQNGFHFVNWTKTGTVTIADLNAASTTANIMESATITAHFAVNTTTYTLNYIAGANGSILGDISQTVISGDSGTQVTATPNAGHQFVSWSDGILAAARTDQHVAASKTVSADFAADPPPEFTYTTNDGKVTITGYSGLGGAVIVPATIYGWPVTSIGDTAFYSCSGLTSITIPDSVTSIGNSAFSYCTGLTSITIPNGVTSIGQEAFFGCTGLTGVTIPNSVTSIGNYAFSFCHGLTNITIPDSVASIENAVFEGCTGLTAITVDVSNSFYRSVDGVLFNKNQDIIIAYPGGKIGSYAIPAGVTSIGYTAFSFCHALTSVTIPASVTSIDDWAFSGSSLTSVTILDSATSIGYGAFSGCTGLASITMGNSVTSIGRDAFYGCSSLTSVAIPASVTSIDEWVFSGCSSLIAITVDPSNPVYGSIDGVLLNKNQKRLIQYPAGKASGSITIQNGITFIGKHAFYGCTSLTSVTIPDTVTNIREGAFNGCTSLTSVIMGNGVTSIEAGAFSGCSSLTGVYFKGNAPFVNSAVFSEASNATVYYLSGTTGWPTVPDTWCSQPTALGDILGVTFSAGAGGTITGTSPQTGAPGFSCTAVTANPGPGYHFVNWTGSPSPSTSNPLTVANVTSNMDLTANFELDVSTYTVIFDLAGKGTISGGGTLSQTVNRGAAALAPIVTACTGWTFTGWDKTFGNITADTTVTAQYSTVTYTVTFVLSGKGSRTGGGELSQTINHGSGATAPIVTANAGWTFNGWDVAFNNITSNLTVTAQWLIISDSPAIVDPGVQKAMIGVTFTLPLTITSESSPLKSVTVAGLPAGLKYDAKTMAITGVPTAAVNKTVTVTAKNTGKTPAVLTFPITVEPLPVWASGTFNGSCVVNGDYGTATMTVTALGKITGKLSASGKNYAFITASYERRDEDNTFLVSIEILVDKAPLPLTLRVTNPAGVEPPNLSVAEGWFSNTAEGDPAVKTYRNVWKDKDVDIATALKPYTGYYTAVLPGNAEYGSGYLAITVDKAGGVKTTGKLADGTALSLSGPLILDENKHMFAVIYTSPAAYKGGCLFGLAKFAKPEGGGKILLNVLDEKVKFIWENRNPQATAEYEEGFDCELELVGGWYDKTENLYDYYQGKDLTARADASAPAPVLTVGVNHYTSDWWNFSGIAITPVLGKASVMTGLIAPKAGVPLDPEKDNDWDYGAENTVGLKIGLTRTTGVFKGSFKAWFDYGKTHTSKSILYEGVLIPECEDKDDGTAGRGFYLCPEKGEDANPFPYTFNQSYDFILQSTPVP